MWPFHTGSVNGGLEPDLRLATPGAGEVLGLLFASTRYYWLRFAAALSADPERAATPDPVDTHVCEVVRGSLAPLEAEVMVRFAHAEPPLAIQRIAALAGFARLSPGRLSVHPVYGPWVALRAVAVVDVPPPPPPAPLPDPCPGCRGRCDAAFARATAEDARPDGAVLARDWRRWLEVRDACRVGREHRYSDDQIRYGYTKDRRVMDALAGGSEPG